MKTTRALLLVGSLAVAALLVQWARPAPAWAIPDTAAACIRIRPEARYGAYGYNHIVHLTDVCASAAECDVSTDVNPEPTHVSVPARSAIEVNTFLGSPARTFVPKVACTMQSGR